MLKMDPNPNDANWIELISDFRFKMSFNESLALSYMRASVYNRSNMACEFLHFFGNDLIFINKLIILFLVLFIIVFIIKWS